MAKHVTDILVLKGLLSPELALESRRRARAEKRPLDEVLYELGVTERDLVMAKSDVLGIPVRFLEGRKIPFEILKNIPEESAKFYQVAPIDEKDGMLEVGMVNPDDVNGQEALKFIASRLGIPFKIFLITPSDLKGVLSDYGSLGGEVTRALSDFEQDLEAESIKVTGKSDKRSKFSGSIFSCHLIRNEAFQGARVSGDNDFTTRIPNRRIRFLYGFGNLIDEFIQLNLPIPFDKRSSVTIEVCRHLFVSLLERFTKLS